MMLCSLAPKISSSSVIAAFRFALAKPIYPSAERSWLRPVKEQFKIKSDDDFKAFLKQQGVSFETIKRMKQRDFIAQSYLQNRIEPCITQLGHVQFGE